MSRRPHMLQSSAGGPSRASSSSSSRDAGANMNTFTFEQLEPGYSLSRGQLCGRLKLLFKEKPDELDYAIKVKLAAASDYAQSKRRTIMVRFVLHPSPADVPCAEQTLAANYALLRRSLGSSMTVDCTGAKVSARRTMGDGTTEVTLRAEGRRAVTIDGTAHEFLKIERPKPPRPRDDWFSPSPAPPTRTIASTSTAAAQPAPAPPVPAATDLPQLTRGDVTRAAAVLRPLSEVPQFVLKQSTASNATRDREHRALVPSAAPNVCAPTLGQNVSDAVRVLANDSRPEYVDLSSANAAAVAPVHAAASPPTRPLLPPPSTASGPETVDTPPSSMPSVENKGADSAKLNLDVGGRGGRVWSSPGTRSNNTGLCYFPDNQLSAVELEAKRRAAAAEHAAETEMHAAIARRPSAPAGAPSVALPIPQHDDGAKQPQPSERKRARDDEDEQSTDVKKPRIDQAQVQVEERARHVAPLLAPPPEQPDALRREAAEAEELRRRQALIRTAQEEAAQRRLDVEALQRPLQVHGRAVPRTYLSLREAASRNSANVAAVIVDVKDVRTAPTGDRTLTIVIADPSSHTNGNASEDMVVTLFRKDPAGVALLSKLEVGMPVLFRALKITTYNAKAKGQMFSNGACTMYTLRGGDVLTTDTASEGLAPAEHERLAALLQWWRDCGEPNTGHTSGARAVGSAITRGSTDCELGAVQEGQYFQLTGKILDMQLNMRGGNFPKYELYVCDGTVSGEPVRDFHGVGARYPHLPRGSIFTLAVQNDPAGPPFAPGQVVRFPNVRVKRYAGQLELIWSDKVTLQQERDGWKSRRHVLLPAADERVMVIEKRLKDWKRGRVPEGQADPRHTSYVPEPEPEAAPAPAPESERVIASHLGTVHTDALLHQRTPSLGAVRDNETVPNRYRILVRVREVLGRGARGSRPGDLALLWCRKCRRPFPESHCRSCEDTAYKHAEARWQLVLRLEDEAGGELIVALSGAQAAAILPPLPSLEGATAADLAKLRAHTIPALTPRAEDVLAGALFDGRRTRPLIDMSLESFAADVQGEPVVAWRVFGMAARS